VRRDLSFVVGTDVAAGAVASVIADAAGDALAACRLFDVFVGAPLPRGKKNLTFSVELRDPEGTMAGEEATAIVERIAAQVVERLGGALRTSEPDPPPSGRV
jgi:phenylalanyl-tRNA synthetase beta chain